MMSESQRCRNGIDFVLMTASVRMVPRLTVVLLLALVTPLAVLAQEEMGGEDSTSGVTVQRERAADSTANRLQLVRNLREIIGRTESRRGRISAAVYSLDQHRLVFDHRAGDALTPASTTKLFYTYAAMKLLGPDYGVPTTVVTDGSVGADSVLYGNVYLVGHGDCLLTPNDIESLAEQMKRSGIKSIQGDVIGDATFFDPVSERQQYSGDAERMQDMPPISALGINRNMVTVLASASGAGGTHVQTIPQSSALRINAAVDRSASQESGMDVKSTESASQRPPGPGRAAIVAPPPTSKSGMTNPDRVVRQRSQRGRRGGRVIRQPGRRPTASPRAKKNSRKGRNGRRRHADTMPLFPAYGTTGTYGDMRMVMSRARRSRRAGRARISVSSVMAPGGIQVFTVRGSLPRNVTRSYTYELGRPALATAGVLVRALQAEGIRVRGAVREGMAPTTAKTIAEFRRPLVELLYPVNKNSDNFVAEHVMKIVGATCCGNTMCSVNAFKTVSSILDSASIPHSGCVLYDGSGLSRRNKTSASTQMYMLKSIAEQPFASTFMNTMAIAGVDGTIRRRMLGTNAVGNVHAKTGTHSSVSALSGYVRSKDGERFCFSFIGNGLPSGVLKQMENACVIQLAEFSVREGTVSLSKPRR